MLRARLVELTAWVNDPAPAGAAGGRRATLADRQPAVPGEDGAGRGARARGGPPSPRRARGRRARTSSSMLERAYGENGSAMSEQKLRDELVTMLSDGPTATSLGMGIRAPAAPPRQARAAARGGARGRQRGVPRRGRQETLRLCPTVPVVMRRLVEPTRARRLHDPRGHDRRTVRLPDAPPARHLPAATRISPERFLEGPPGTYTWIPVRRRRASLRRRELRAA